MVQPSTHAFMTSEVRLARYARALGHPARVAILKILATRGPRLVGQIVDELPLAQSTVSQHLKALREAGLVAMAIDGPRSRYSLDADAIRSFKGGIQLMLHQLDHAVGADDDRAAPGE